MRRLVYIFLILSVGCGRKAMDEEELMAFVQDESHGLTRIEQYNEFKIVAAYKPTDLIVRQQMEKGTAPEVDSLRKAYSPYLYFTLRIERNGKDLETSFASDLSTFPEKISYLAAGFSEKVSLSTASDNVAIEDYIYMRSFGTGPSTFLLVFSKPADNDFDLVIEGHDLGFGKLRFPFELSDIENTPQLKL